MRIFKIMKSLCFVFVLGLVNILLSFLLEPVYGVSDSMWREYSEETALDTIFVGSSVCATTFDPQILGETLAIKSFNMGTPAQPIGQSLDAIEIAHKEHGIQTVIMGTGFFIFQEDPTEEAEMTFTMGHARLKGGIEGLLESISYMLSEEVVRTENSINYAFPWLYNHVEISPNAIYRNVADKLQAKKDDELREDVNAEGEKGFRPYYGEIDKDTIWTNNSYYCYSGTLEPRMMAKFKELMTYCNENGIELIVVNTPHPAYDIVTGYSYYENMDRVISGLCKDYGAAYYDFSLVKPELFENKMEYFYDFEHLNYDGAQKFSNMFCKFLQKRQNGEDVEQYFYTVKEFYEANESLLEEWMNTRGISR